MTNNPARTSEHGDHFATSSPQRPERTPKLSDYLRIFSYASKWDFCVYMIAALASLGAGVTMPLMNVVLGQLVGDFTNYFKDPSTVPPGAFERILEKQALYIVALFFVRWGLNSTNKFCFRMIGIRLSAAIRHHYLQSLLAQSIHVIDSIPPGAPATAITATSNTLQIGVSERLGTFLTFNATIWSALIVAFIWSWDLTLVTASLILYISVILAVVMPIFIKAQAAILEADAQGTAIASEALEGIRLVNACGAHEHVTTRYSEWVDKAMKRAQKVAPVVGIQFGLVVCFNISSKPSQQLKLTFR
jgi:ATP-binding cassette subfamily B (MDR/TAP) protein 1